MDTGSERLGRPDCTHSNAHPSCLWEPESHTPRILQPLHGAECAVTDTEHCTSAALVRCLQLRGAQAGCRLGWGPAGCVAGSSPLHGACVSRQASWCSAKHVSSGPGLPKRHWLWRGHHLTSFSGQMWLRWAGLPCFLALSESWSCFVPPLPSPEGVPTEISCRAALSTASQSGGGV